MAIVESTQSPFHQIAKAIGLAVILLALRLVYLQHPWPVHPDESGFIDAIGFPAKYPVHPPGYPLWVALGTTLHALGFSPYASYQAWSVAASILLPALVYLSLARGVRDALAWWVAAALGVCPLLWFTAATALNYAAGGAVGWGVVVLCHRALTENRSRPLMAAALLAAVGLCLRADILLTTGAVIAFVAWKLRALGGLKALFILAAGVILLAGAAALVYVRAGSSQPSSSFAHTLQVVLGASVFKLGLVDGLARNTVKLGMNLAWHFGVAVLLLPFALLYHGRHAKRDTRILLLLWWVPTTAFFLFIHMTEPGHTLPLVLVGYVVIALWLNGRLKPTAAVKIAAAMAVLSMVQFVFYPWSTSGTGFKRLLDAKIAYVSGTGLRQIDRRADIHQPGDYWPTSVHHTGTSKPEEGRGR